MTHGELVSRAELVSEGFTYLPRHVPAFLRAGRLVLDVDPRRTRLDHHLRQPHHSRQAYHAS